MIPTEHPWEKIFRTEGNVFPEPFPRFGEVVDIFREHNCSRVLDLGSGSGRHVVHLAKAGFETFGLDISSTGLRMTREWLHREKSAAEVAQADMRSPLPYQEGVFDGLLSTQVIHHARHTEVLGTIAEIWRILAPGGLAFVTVAAWKPLGSDYSEIESGTFVPKTGHEAGLPHHIFREDELREAFSDFVVKDVSLRDEGNILAILAQK